MSAGGATPASSQPKTHPELPPDLPCHSAAQGASRSEPAMLSDTVLVQKAQAGDLEALEALLIRYGPRFLRHAERACGDPTVAEDLRQDACRRAIAKMRYLRNADAFCPWVLAFITNEARNWRGGLKKGGTSVEELTLKDIQSMSFEPSKHSAVGLEYLHGLLWQEARKTAVPWRRTARFMLSYYAQEQEFPPVRTIAEATHSSHGTAQRYRDAIFHAWRRMLAAFDLRP